MRAGIALGANLGDRLRCLTTAREQIFALPDVAPPFLSSVALRDRAGRMRSRARRSFSTPWSRLAMPVRLSRTARELKKIEPISGGPPNMQRNRSRTIDLDLLYHGGAIGRRSAARNCRIRVCICAALSCSRWPKSGRTWSCPGQTATVRKWRAGTRRRTLRWCGCPAVVASRGDGRFSRAQTPGRTDHCAHGLRLSDRAAARRKRDRHHPCRRLVRHGRARLSRHDRGEVRGDAASHPGRGARSEAGAARGRSFHWHLRHAGAGGRERAAPGRGRARRR